MDSNQSEVVNTLLEMGFEQQIINQAIQETNSSALEVLITYIENKQNNPSDFQQQSIASEPQEKTQSITSYVNQEFVAILISMGFSKNVSEKALLLSGNKSVESAQEWIEQHKTDQDFEEEMRIIDQQGSTISREEAELKARELQQKIRERRKKLDEEAELERERNRIQSGKQMTQVRREMEELKKKQEAERQKKQRQQDQKDKEEMLEQLRRDKEERFGKKIPGNTQQQKQEKVYTPFEMYTIGIKQIKVAQPPDLLPDVAKNSLTLISKILENIIKNPQELKFRKISLASQAFKQKIDEVFGAKNALDALGFIEEDGFYIYKQYDFQTLSQAFQIALQEMQGL